MAENPSETISDPVFGLVRKRKGAFMTPAAPRILPYSGRLKRRIASPSKEWVQDGNFLSNVIDQHLTKVPDLRPQKCVFVHHPHSATPSG
jgi:hypothetical protein